MIMIGSGILKGMAVTARNFIGSYFEDDRLTIIEPCGCNESFRHPEDLLHAATEHL